MDYDVVKVIDPHKHMPESVKDAFFKIHRELEMNNDSYVYWKIKDWEAELKNSDAATTNYIKSINSWLREIGIPDDESVIILHWW